MNAQNSIQSNRLVVAILLISSPMIIMLAYLIGLEQFDQIIMGFQIILFGIMLIAVYRQPYLGLVISVTSLPIIDTLPRIPYANFAVSILGGMSLVSYILGWLREPKSSTVDRTGALIWGGILIAWFLLTNPAAALLPAEGGRNWLFTFIQLILLAWLVSKLMDTPRKHHVLMWSFSIASLISAVYSIQEGIIGESLLESIRGSGLAVGANSAARYFIVALIFLYYLRTTISNTFQRQLVTLSVGVMIFAVMGTVSRTGLILLFAGIGMLSIQRAKVRNQGQAGVILALLVTVIWVFADNIFSILRGIFPAVQLGTDTVGLRYKLWIAGLRMWQDHVVQGVGIGQYIEQLVVYGRDILPSYRLRLGAHNMYIQVLAETGAIGFSLFMLQLGSALKLLRKAVINNDHEISKLANTWFIVFVIMLLGGITKQDHYDKLIWMAIGISALPMWVDNITKEPDVT